MDIKKNKTKISAITFVLVLTISATLVVFPIVVAHDPPWIVPTWAFIALTNPVVGRGQTVYIIFWSHVEPPTGMGAYGDRWTWTVEVTKPDGSKDTLGPIKSDPVGAAYTSYTPDQVGTYTFVSIWHEHTITGEPQPPPGTNPRAPETVGDTFLEARSDPATLIVQEDPIEAWEETPITTDYWERPINAMNRNWYVLAGNWLAGAAQNVGPTSRFNYGTGPESAHIMWSTPMWAGGIMDARFGVTGYQTAHYEGLSFTPPIILNGKIYYNIRTLPREGWRVLDLYTGEELWFHNTTGPVRGVRYSSSGSIAGEYLAFGQILDFECPNQHGGFPYLWSTTHPTESNTWMMFDAETGSYICSIANVSSSGTAVYGKEGSILRYRISGPSGAMRLTVWNSTRAIWYKETWVSNEFWMWRPGLNETYDGRNGFSLNVSIPDVSGSIRAVREGEFIIGGTAGSNDPDGLVEGNLWCLSLEPGKEGTLLWNITFTPPYIEATYDELMISGSLSYHGPELTAVVPEYGVFIFRQEMTGVYWGYSLETGEELWGPTESMSQWTIYGMSESIYQGRLVGIARYGGKMVGYNITTGDFLWEYTAEQEGFESPYGNYPIGITCIADGKLYLTSSEHSPTQPLWRGSYLRCIDVETGEELWKINHWGMGMGGGSGVVIADGFLVGLNAYDNQIYCYGKGPSATKVTSEPAVVTKGSSVLIKGTVTDQSPGAKTTEVMAKSSYAEGVPCIADEYMSEWMEYLYMQQPIPVDAKGVEVTLDAIDPNGNFIHIDTVTSDMSGFFSCKWTPEHEGKYTIMATFEGSEAYGSSYSETAIGVDPAPAPSGPIEPEPTEPTEAPLITTEIAILIAVVVVAVIGVAAYWVLRKRK